MSRKLSKKVPDEYKHFFKCENDLLYLIQKCEPLNEQQLNELLKLANDTSFKQVRVNLLEKKEEYIQCLQLFWEGMKEG